jgi:hypothetical protein
MPKTALAAALVVLILAAVTPTAQAMPIMVPHHSVVAGLNADLQDVQSRRCWRDRWGRLRCRTCWRDRWGRVRCR